MQAGRFKALLALNKMDFYVFYTFLINLMCPLFITMSFCILTNVFDLGKYYKLAVPTAFIAVVTAILCGIQVPVVGLAYLIPAGFIFYVVARLQRFLKKESKKGNVKSIALRPGTYTMLDRSYDYVFRTDPLFFPPEQKDYLGFICCGNDLIKMSQLTWMEKDAEYQLLCNYRGESESGKYHIWNCFAPIVIHRPFSVRRILRRICGAFIIGYVSCVLALTSTVQNAGLYIQPELVSYLNDMMVSLVAVFIFNWCRNTTRMSRGIIKFLYYVFTVLLVILVFCIIINLFSIPGII